MYVNRKLYVMSVIWFAQVIYKEDHKIKSIREDFANWYTEPTELKLPQDFGQTSTKTSQQK